MSAGPDGTIFFGGNFTSVQGSPKEGLAQVDGVTGEPTSFAPTFPGTNYFSRVSPVRFYNGSLYLSWSGFFVPIPPGFPYYFRYKPPFTPNPAKIPLVPRINFYLRKNGQTLLRWDKVLRNVDLSWATVTSYRVYRSSNTNLETYELVREISTIDVRGSVDTMFTELIEGFYGYAVTALTVAGESEKVYAKAVNSTSDLDLI